VTFVTLIKWNLCTQSFPDSYITWVARSKVKIMRSHTVFYILINGWIYLEFDTRPHIAQQDMQYANSGPQFHTTKPLLLTAFVQVCSSFCDISICSGSFSSFLPPPRRLWFHHRLLHGLSESWIAQKAIDKFSWNLWCQKIHFSCHWDSFLYSHCQYIFIFLFYTFCLYIAFNLIYPLFDPWL